MVDLIASKSMQYATRRLLANDSFQAGPRDARVLVAIGKARLAPAPTPEPDSGADSDIAAIRQDYEAALGKRPFMGWDEATLREKIAAHRAAD